MQLLYVAHAANSVSAVNLHCSSSCHLWPQGVAEAAGVEGKLEGAGGAVVTLTVEAIQRMTQREGV